MSVCVLAGQGQWAAWGGVMACCAGCFVMTMPWLCTQSACQSASGVGGVPELA